MRNHFLRAVPKGAIRVLEYIGVSTANGGSTNTCTLSVPSGTQSGDLLVAVFSGPNTTSILSVPSGWTKNLDSSARSVASRIWDGVSSTYSFTTSVTGTTFSGVMLSFRNAAFDVVSAVSTTADDPIAPSITISTSGSIQVVCAATFGNTTTTYTQTSGFTEVADLNTLTTPRGPLAVQYSTNRPAGATGTVTYASDGVTINNRAWQFSIKFA